MDSPVTETEIIEMLDHLNEFTKERSLRSFITDEVSLGTAMVLVSKAKQDGAWTDLIRLVAFGTFLAEQGKTHLMEVHH